MRNVQCGKYTGNLCDTVPVDSTQKLHVYRENNNITINHSLKVLLCKAYKINNVIVLINVHCKSRL